MGTISMAALAQAVPLKPAEPRPLPRRLQWVLSTSTRVALVLLMAVLMMGHVILTVALRCMRYLHELYDRVPTAPPVPAPLAAAKGGPQHFYIGDEEVQQGANRDDDDDAISKTHETSVVAEEVGAAESAGPSGHANEAAGARPMACMRPDATTIFRRLAASLPGDDVMVYIPEQVISSSKPCSPFSAGAPPSTHHEQADAVAVCPDVSTAIPSVMSTELSCDVVVPTIHADACRNEVSPMAASYNVPVVSHVHEVPDALSETPEGRGYASGHEASICTTPDPPPSGNDECQLGMIVHESRDVSVRGNTSEPQGDPTVPDAPPSTSCDRIRWCDHPPADGIISSTDTHASIPSVAPNYDLWASPDHFLQILCIVFSCNSVTGQQFLCHRISLTVSEAWRRDGGPIRMPSRSPTRSSRAYSSSFMVN